MARDADVVRVRTVDADGQQTDPHPIDALLKTFDHIKENHKDDDEIVIDIPQNLEMYEDEKLNKAMQVI